MTIQTREIDNPWFDPDYAESKSNPRTIEVQTNTRESSIAAMRARGQIDDDQLEAAERFRKIYEMSGQGGVKALDWTKERVDGGRVTDGLPATRMDALTQLNGLEKVLGKFPYALCVHIVGERKSIKRAAMDMRGGDLTKDEIKNFGWLLRQSLDSLAILWGYKEPGRLTKGGA